MTWLFILPTPTSDIYINLQVCLQIIQDVTFLMTSQSYTENTSNIKIAHSRLKVGQNEIKKTAIHCHISLINLPMVLAHIILLHI